MRSSPDPRTAVVTGAGSGLGRTVAQRLLTNGYTVFGSCVDLEEAARLREALKGDFEPVVLDVRDPSSVARAAEVVGETLSGRPLKALVNAAGVVTNGPLLDLDAETFLDVLAVNVVGVHEVTRAFVPLLRPHEHPRIVNISSASGRRTVPFTTAYAASKFAVEALSSGMRMELAPFGIGVAVVAPGLMRTAMADRILAGLAQAPTHDVYREPLRRFRERTAAGLQGGVPVEEVADAVIQAIARLSPPTRQAVERPLGRKAAILRRLQSQDRREADLARGLGLTHEG